ncbi:hypothetical protein [Spirosoma sp.]|uniref:hypothetical protein n=1 Tax=Spirosoma sp. TaxID=1899569 RepID=UPI00260A09C3|nr:hypothetical protein [Spirosoma sp.]MCX6216497.1 hypothetical protein [Spirosoma sp.]
MKNLLLQQALTALLAANPKLRYDDGSGDSSGEKLKIVRLPWWRVRLWKGERDGKAEARLKYWEENVPASAELCALLTAPNSLVSFKRNINKDVKVDLYILVSFGWWYVGIKTTLIET